VGVEELNLDKGAGLNDCPKPKEERMGVGSNRLQPRIEESKRYENPG